MKRYSDICGLILPTLGILLCPSIGAQEVNVGWHDHMYLRPGDGVQLNRQQEPIFPGLVQMSSTGTTTGNTGYSTTEAAFAHDTYDMIHTLNINSSVSLNGLVFDGDVDASFFGRQTFDANDLTFVVTTTRNFGTTKFDALSFSSDFWNQAAVYQKKNLQEAALYSALTSTFGTHFVRGYESEAMVSVIYSFHYASAAAKQQAGLSVGGGVGDFANFSTYVGSFFGSTNTTASMSYRFYSTDPLLPATNFGFASAGVITNLAQFSTFASNIQNYANSMSQTNAKITGYVLDPLSFGPGVLGILGGYTPVQPIPANYDPFLQDYSALQAWKQSVDPWILDGSSLSWLNDQGRQVVQSHWLEAGRDLALMKSIAAGHFTTNAPLNVPTDVANFLTNLSDISLPTIYVMDSFVSGSTRWIIGRVDCGCRDLAITIPFNNISELYYGTNNGTLDTIYYDPVAFENSSTNAGYPSAVNTELQNVFRGVKSQWACYTNVGINPNLNGYFVASEPTSQAANWTLALCTGTDANRNPIVVDAMRFLDTRSGGCPGSCLITITNLASRR